MNGMPVRIGLVLALLAAALLAGLLLSGFLVLHLLKLESPLAWDTYLPYARALDLPEVRLYAGSIRLAGVLGFGIPVLGWALGACFLLGSIPQAHGASRVVRPMRAPAHPERPPGGDAGQAKPDRARFVVYPEEGTEMNHATQAVAAAASLALAACATPNRDKAPQNAQSAVLGAQARDQAAPANPAQALGQKLLGLIGGLKHKDDLTVERVNAALGVQMHKRAKASRAYEATVSLNDLWQYWIGFDEPSESRASRLQIGITEKDRSKPLQLSEVCLEFEPFAAALGRLGYTLEEKRYYKDGNPTGDWRLYRRKPEHEYNQEQLALADLYPLEGQGPVEISIASPWDEFATTFGESAGGRRCIQNLDVEGAGGET